MKRAQHLCLWDHPDCGRFESRGGGDADRLFGKAPLAEKVAAAQNANHCFLARARNDRSLHPAFADEQNVPRGIALNEDDLILSEVPQAFGDSEGVKKSFDVKRALAGRFHQQDPCV